MLIFKLDRGIFEILQYERQILRIPYHLRLLRIVMTAVLSFARYDVCFGLMNMAFGTNNGVLVYCAEITRVHRAQAR